MDEQQQAGTPAEQTAQIAQQQPTGTMEFSSNPFKSSLKGLGKVLSVNPVTSISIPIVAFAAVIGFYVLFGLLAAVTDGNDAVMALFGIAGFIFVLIVVIRTVAAAVVVHQYSNNGKQLTSREALTTASSEQLTTFTITMIITAFLIAVGLVALVLPGIFLMVKFSLVPFVVYEEKKGYTDALKRSWQLTSGHFFEMLGAIVAQSLITGNGLLSFVGANAGLANRYYELKEAESKNASTGPTHWLNYVIPVVIGLFMALYIGVIVWASSQTSNNFDFNSDEPSFEELFNATSSEEEAFEALFQGLSDEFAE